MFNFIDKFLETIRYAKDRFYFLKIANNIVQEYSWLFIIIIINLLVINLNYFNWHDNNGIGCVYILILPLFSSICSGLFGFYIGWKGAAVISIVLLSSTLLHVIFIFYNTCFLGNVWFFSLFNWINSGSLIVDWSFSFDSLSSTMLVLIVFLSLLVHIYSCGYMINDPHLPRFLSYLSLFTFSMIILVTADNFLVLFFGWEGVGICSYLLISFWFTRVQANKAALKAIIVNKIADVGLILAMCVIYEICRSLDFSVLFILTPYILESFNLKLNSSYNNINYIEIICILLAIGAIGKSSQLGLHVWLPDAMEGPTPVSALLHAATMVTAGVYLIIRCSPIFEYAPNTLAFLTCLGATTALFGSAVGLVQTDIKKIIAYSTCSQLGYMVLAAGLSNYNVSLFHLVNHAFFKALLFLSAGSIIHSLSDEQDIRKMGGLYNALPITFICFSVGSLSLMGFPYTSGYYSKELIINLSYSSYTIPGLYAYWLSTISAMLTAIYSFRLLFWVFLSKTNGHRVVYLKLQESSFLMLTPMIILSFFSIFSGFLLKDFFSATSCVYADSIFIKPENFKQLYVEFIPIYVKLIPTILSLVSAFFTVFLLKFYNKEITRFIYSYYAVFVLYEILCNAFYFDLIYNKYIAEPFIKLTSTSYVSVDKELIEFFGPRSVAFLSNFFNINVNKLTIREDTNIKKQISSFILVLLCVLVIINVVYIFFK